MGKLLSGRETILYLLLFQGYLSIPNAVRHLHRYHRTRGEKRRKEQPGHWCHLQKFKTKKRSDKKDSEDPLADVPDWLKDFKETNRIACILTQFSGFCNQLDYDRERQQWIYSSKRRYHQHLVSIYHALDAFEYSESGAASCPHS